MSHDPACDCKVCRATALVTRWNGRGIHIDYAYPDDGIYIGRVIGADPRRAIYRAGYGPEGGECYPMDDNGIWHRAAGGWCSHVLALKFKVESGGVVSEQAGESIRSGAASLSIKGADA